MKVECILEGSYVRWFCPIFIPLILIPDKQFEKLIHAGEIAI